MYRRDKEDMDYTHDKKENRIFLAHYQEEQEERGVG